jgi:hypothetical protein
VISCPKCGSELPAGITVCVTCGANANEKPDVDNSAEISRMFGKETDGLSEKIITDFESGKEVELSELDGALSAMNEINFDEILGEGVEVQLEPQPAKPAAKPVFQAPHDSHGSEHEHDDDFGAAHDDDHDDIIIQKGVTEVHGFRLPKPVQRIIACIVILAAGFGIGYGVKYFEEQGVFASYTNDISLKSLIAVNSHAIPAGYRFKAVEIHVKRDAATTECIILGVLITQAGDYTPTYFRHMINNSDHSDTTLFLPFNQERYDELLASGDAQDRLDAGTMMNRYETFLLSLAEINADNPRWERADIEFVNKQLSRQG